MNKYQALSKLCDKMIQPRFVNRSKSCQQILNDRNLWALMDNEFNINEEFKEFSANCDEEYKNVYKVIELMTKNSRSDLIYDTDSDEISRTSENSDFSEDTDSSEDFDICQESDSSKDSNSPALKRIRTNSL